MIVVYKLWRPASVVYPDKTAAHRRAVYLTNQGLRVFADKGEPEFNSPVDFSTTPEPRSSQHHVGIDITTEAGLVVVTPTGGCQSCGSRMRGWAPEWANQVAAWPGRAES